MIYKGETMPDLTIETRWYCKCCGWDEEKDGGTPEDGACPQCSSENLDIYRVAV
jgi:rubredoxin